MSVETSTWPLWGYYSVYQPLVNFNISAEYNNGVIQFQPVLASGWNVSSDGLTYNFALRNVSFSDGNPVNSYQIWALMYSHYYLSANATTWFGGYGLFNMSNVNFGPSTLALLNQSGVINPTSQLLQIMSNSSWPIYVDGPSHIVFRTLVANDFFLTEATYWTAAYDVQWAIIHGGYGTPAAPNPYFVQNAAPGSGPYTTTAVVQNSYVEFTQNPNYWGNSLTQAEINANEVLDPGHAKTVFVYYKPDDLARYTDLATGQAQIVGIGSADWNLVQANPDKFQTFSLPQWGAIFTAVSLNTRLYPTNITDVRQAIVHAINYSDISQTVFYGDTLPMVGPETPIWSNYYDLGNLSSYSYNVTLAQHYLSEANITNMPTLTFTAESGCSYCNAIAQIVQADLAQIGITVNIEVQALSSYFAPYGSYSTNYQNAAQMGQISLLGGGYYTEETPADGWTYFLSNNTFWGNWAVYYNPTVQACIDSYFTTGNSSLIRSLCQPAQAQVYNDAPYAWLGLDRLWYIDGSLVWQKGVVNSFLLDPDWGGADTAPIINTVTFG